MSTGESNLQVQNLWLKRAHLDCTKQVSILCISVLIFKKVLQGLAMGAGQGLILGLLPLEFSALI